ncbi:MAG: TIM barrel protein [Saprospiraceae bacterium]
MTKKPILLTLLLAILLGSTGNTQELGMQMGSMRQLMAQDIALTLQRLQDLGVKYIEGSRARGLSAKEYKQKLDQYGIQVIADGIGFPDLQEPDSIKSRIERAKIFGTPYFVCYWIPHDGDNFTFADMKNAVEVFNTAGKQLAEAGIALVYHPHGYEFREYDGEGTMFDYLLTNTDPRYINFQMDVFWIRNPGQNPAAILRKYPGRFPLTHLKDRRKGTIGNQNGRQDKETNVTLGMGDVNIAEVIKAAKETGVKYHIIEDESSRAANQVTQSVAYLRELELDRLALEGVVNSLSKALVDADETALTNLTSEELTYGHSSGAIEDRATFINNVVNGNLDFQTWDTSDQEVTVKGNTAWVRHNIQSSMVNKSNNSTTDIKLKVLLVWTKEDGNWKLLARQAVR